MCLGKKQTAQVLRFLQPYGRTGKVPWLLPLDWSLQPFRSLPVDGTFPPSSLCVTAFQINYSGGKTPGFMGTTKKQGFKKRWVGHFLRHNLSLEMLLVVGNRARKVLLKSEKSDI